MKYFCFHKKFKTSPVFSGIKEVTDNDFRELRIAKRVPFEDGLFFDGQAVPIVAVWSCGRLCSGVAIGPSKILTTGFCLHEGPGEWCYRIEVMGYKDGWKKQRKPFVRLAVPECYAYGQSGSKR